MDNGIAYRDVKDVPVSLQKTLRHWRNSPQVANYFQLQRIDAATHESWLASLKQPSPVNVAYVIFYDDKPIGLTYFMNIDTTKGSADWGMYIYDEGLRGKGIGKEVLTWSLNEARSMNVAKVYLEVLQTNTAAVSLYKKVGFVFVNKKNEMVDRFQILLTVP